MPDPLNDQESTIPAEALGSRPAASRTAARNASWIRSVVRSAAQRWKYQYTVTLGGKPCGIIRHAHAVRSPQRIASTIRRRGWIAGRDPVSTGTVGSSMDDEESIRKTTFSRREDARRQIALNHEKETGNG
jgi:hypothetical protein